MNIKNHLPNQLRPVRLLEVFGASIAVNIRQPLLIMTVILAGLFLFSIFCWVLIDWCQAIQQDRYKHEPLNLLMESLAIIAYSYLGFRFLQSRLPGSQPPTL